MAFPLYRSLEKLVKKPQFTAEEESVHQSRFLNNVRQLKNSDMTNLARVVVYHHFKDNEVSSSIPIPYNGQVLYGGRGLTLNLNNLPQDLRFLLYAYVEHVNGII